MGIPRIEFLTLVGAEPVSVGALKAQLRITNAQELDLLASVAKAARTKAENYTGRTIAKKTLRQWMDRPPGGNSKWHDGIVQAPISSVDRSPTVEIVTGPLISVEAITSYSDTDAATVASASTYYVDKVDSMRLGRVSLRLGQIWPISYRRFNGFSIDFTAGYEDNAVPTDLLDALNKLAAWLFTHRGDYTDEKAIRDAGAYAGLDDYVYRKIST